MTGTKQEAATRAPNENPEKDPEDWITGDEPMTGPQRSYLKTLCHEAGEEFDETLDQGRCVAPHRRAAGEDRPWRGAGKDGAH